MICRICHEVGDESKLLLCDAPKRRGNGQTCNAAYHTTCLHLKEIPEGDWYCPHCQKARESQECEAAKADSDTVSTRSGSTTQTKGSSSSSRSILTEKPKKSPKKRARSSSSRSSLSEKPKKAPKKKAKPSKAKPSKAKPIKDEAPLTEKEKDDLQEKIDQLTEDQLTTVFEFVQANYDVADDQTNVDLDLDNMPPAKQRHFLQLVNEEFLRGQKRRVE